MPPMDKEANAAPPSPSERAAAAAWAMAGTLQLARSLAQSHASLDLAGLEWDIGRLCATSLDLPPDEGRSLRPLLGSVLAELDALRACLAAQSEETA